MWLAAIYGFLSGILPILDLSLFYALNWQIPRQPPIPAAITCLMLAFFLLLEGGYRLKEKAEIKEPALSSDWSDLAERFHQVGVSVRCDFRTNWDGTETWSICDSQQRSNQFAETLCRQAGNMLLRSRRTLPKLSPKIRETADPIGRWLNFVSDLSKITPTLQGYDIVGGVKHSIYACSINQIAFSGHQACMTCAANEAE